MQHYVSFNCPFFQSDLRSKTEQYNRQTMDLNQELQSHKMRKENLRTRVVCFPYFFLFLLKN